MAHALIKLFTEADESMIVQFTMLLVEKHIAKLI